MADIVSNESDGYRALSAWDFDQGQGGWRRYEWTHEPAKAVAMITSYLAAHENELRAITETNKAEKTLRLEILYFHRGQLEAQVGEERYPAAIEDFKRSYYGDQSWWDIYVRGTIAYLLRDRAGVRLALLDLQSEEAASGEDRNASFMENFLAALDQKNYSYASAYALPRKKRRAPRRDVAL